MFQKALKLRLRVAILENSEMKKLFIYGEEELNFLKKRDSLLGTYIDRIGYLTRYVNSNIYQSLVEAIIAQQISGKAAATVLNRIEQLVYVINPTNINQCSDEALQQCGLSFRKVSYIKDFTQKILNHEINLLELEHLPDQEVIKKLNDLKGFGPWTAEMLLIFSFGRKNVLSFSDFAIQKGLRLLYHHRKITPKLFLKYKKRYSPYGTIAAFYLWDIATNEYGLKDNLKKTKKS
jgi:DNA-3-methyladenine glycosylase II